MEELVAKVFVLSAATLIVFAIMFGLAVKIQPTENEIEAGEPIVTTTLSTKSATR